MTAHPDSPAWLLSLLAAARLVVLGLGLLVTIISYRAYRRTGIPYLRTATVGFGVISVGVFVEGVLFELFGLDLAAVHLVESVAIGVGFVVLLWSLRQ